MPTYRLLLEYDGAEFCGWQAQAGGPTVQQAIEDALSVALRASTRVVGAGRTDAGVHARGQVAHIRCDVDVEPRRLRRTLEGLLPRTIAVREVTLERDDFHARFEAVRRVYRYHVATEARAIDRSARWRLHPAPDFERMNGAAAALLGRHDFSAFCITQSMTRNRICRVEHAAWSPEERAGDWRFEIRADRFLHGMVRAIVGTLVEIGRGNRAQDVADVLTSRDRRRAGRSAPPHGLVLERVEYDARGDNATSAGTLSETPGGADQ